MAAIPYFLTIFNYIDFLKGTIVKVLSLRAALNIALCSSLLGISSHTFAASVGAGLGFTNEFPGSGDLQVIPLAAFEVETPVGIFKTNQIGVELDIIKSGIADTGPILRYNTGRNDSVSDNVVAALPEVEGSAEAGWFVGSGFQLKNLGLDSQAIVIGNLSAVTDVGDGHGGTVVEASVGVVLPVNENLRFVPSINFTYGDGNFTKAFYGVSAESAAQSELTEFTPSGGLERTQLAVVAIHTINEQWSVTGIAGYAALQGDAAESPITKRGSDTQSFTGVVFNYSF